MSTLTHRLLKFPLLIGIASCALCTAAVAEVAETMHHPGISRETQLVMLGTGGGPILRKDRSESATLLIVDDSYYLIDCGIGTMRRLIEAGVQPSSVKTVFITHNHPDHNLDLAPFVANAGYYLQGRGENEPGFNIYGPEGTSTMVEASARYATVPLDIFAKEGLGRPVDVSRYVTAHDLMTEGLIYQDDKIRVTAVENSHFTGLDDAHRPVSKSYAYRIETPNAAIVFTGDTSSSTKVAQLAKNADVLVSEIMNGPAAIAMIEQIAAANHWPEAQKQTVLWHMTETHLLPEEVAQLASQAGVKSVLLNHFGPGMDGDAAEVRQDLAGIRAGYRGQLIASSDGERYCVNARRWHGAPLSKCDE